MRYSREKILLRIGWCEIAITPLDETSRTCLSNKTSTKLCKRERENNFKCTTYHACLLVHFGFGHALFTVSLDWELYIYVKKKLLKNTIQLSVCFNANIFCNTHCSKKRKWNVNAPFINYHFNVNMIPVYLHLNFLRSTPSSLSCRSVLLAHITKFLNAKRQIRWLMTAWKAISQPFYGGKCPLPPAETKFEVFILKFMQVGNK